MKQSTCICLVKSAALACLLALAGCAVNVPANPFNGPVTTLNTVDPGPADVHPADPAQGCLKVYSATTEYNDGGLMYYPHSKYSIHLPGGACYKRVDNHAARGDENPQLVTLPAGTYYVLALSEMDGLVKVPVVIAASRTTVVNLESGRAHSP